MIKYQSITKYLEVKLKLTNYNTNKTKHHNETTTSFAHLIFKNKIILKNIIINYNLNLTSLLLYISVKLSNNIKEIFLMIFSVKYKI